MSAYGHRLKPSGVCIPDLIETVPEKAGTHRKLQWAGSSDGFVSLIYSVPYTCPSVLHVFLVSTNGEPFQKNLTDFNPSHILCHAIPN